MARPPLILAIGGLDGSGGAGILADARAVQLNGGFPCTVLTTITAQNSQGISTIQPVSAEVLRFQMRALIQDFEFAAVKLGAIPTLECAEVIEEFLTKELSKCWIVLDPVMASSSGQKLVDDSALQFIVESILPHVTIVTPNTGEAAILAASAPIDCLSDASNAGLVILRYGCRNVLVKGGHLTDGIGTDIWCHGSLVEEIQATAVFKNTVRGTGCMLASSLACLLAQGLDMRKAIRQAKRFIEDALATGTALGQGTAMSTLGVKKA